MSAINRSESFLRGLASVRLTLEDLDTSKKQMDSIYQKVDALHAQLLVEIAIFDKETAIHQEKKKKYETEYNHLKAIAVLDALDPLSEENDWLRKIIYEGMSTEKSVFYVQDSSSPTLLEVVASETPTLLEVVAPATPTILEIVAPATPTLLEPFVRTIPLEIVNPDNRCHARRVLKSTKNSENSDIGVEKDGSCFLSKYKFKIYFETQCQKDSINGEFLCATCSGRRKRAEKGHYLMTGIGSTSEWSGVIGEIPLPLSHFVGSEWSNKTIKSSPSSSSSSSTRSP